MMPMMPIIPTPPTLPTREARVATLLIGASLLENASPGPWYDPTMASEADGKANAKPTELGPEVFDDFDAFMKQAIRDYYDRSWKSRRGNFVALIIASGQAMSMAVDSVKDGTGLKKAALGAAGVVALRIGLRYALSGPLGIILTGAAAVSL